MSYIGKRMDWGGNKEGRAKQQYLRAQNARFTNEFVPLSKDLWPPAIPGWTPPVSVWRSKLYFVQVFEHDGGVIRLTINRTMCDNRGNWLDGITWDELYRIKNKLGYSDRQAIEIFPPEKDLVNVANMRHIWILPTPVPVNLKANA